jgi:hypothetical protein
MKDTEIRWLLLQRYYEKRREGFTIPTLKDFDGKLSEEDILYGSDELGQLGLIEWKSVKDGGRIAAGMGRITPRGVEVVEGEAQSPVSVDRSKQDYNIKGSSSQSEPDSDAFGYNYDVALSFAGEDRAFAEAVAKGLRDAGVQVFYDDFFAAKLWGEELSAKLREVYHDSSEFCIMVISQYYVDKIWTNFERQQAIERLIKEKGKAYVLPVRLDGFTGEVPGLSGTIRYLPVQRNEHKRVIKTFLDKIGRKSHRKEIATESTWERAERLSQEHEKKQELEEFLKSDDGVKAAKNAVRNIFSYLKMEVDAIRSGNPHYEITYSASENLENEKEESANVQVKREEVMPGGVREVRHGFLLKWVQPKSDSLDFAKLAVHEWSHTYWQTYDEKEFRFTLDEQNLSAWYETTAPDRLYSSKRIAENYLSHLIEKVIPSKE